MEDKKQPLAILLIILVIITYFQYISAKEQKKKTLSRNQQQTQVSPEHTAASPLLTAAPSADKRTAIDLPNSQSAVPELENIKNADKTVIDNGALRVSLTHLGARIQSLEFIGIYKDLSKTDFFNLVPMLDGVSLPAGIRTGRITDEGVLYHLDSFQGFIREADGSFKSADSDSSKIVLKANLREGLSIEKIFTFTNKSYIFDISANITGAKTDQKSVELTWPIHVAKKDLGQRFDPYFFTILHADKSVKHTQAVSNLDDLLKPQSAEWLSFGDRYFMTALLPSAQDENVKIEKSEELFTLIAQQPGNSVSSRIFAGPKKYDDLKTYGLSLERSIDLGFFSFISYPLLQLLKLLFSFFGNYGVAIVALTLLVKTAMYPLNRASLMSMKGMQEISPEIQTLKERIKDPTQLNKEIFALYKRKGVNPMGGCLPVAIQIPVFFGLYSALQNAVELRHAPFALWVKDLATPEKLSLFGINIPVIVIAMGAIMFIQQYRTPMPNVEPAQRKMVLSMSVIFTLMFLIFPFPAGLALYMLVNTVISLVQQQCLRSEALNKPFTVTLAASCAILAIALAVSKL